MADEEPVRAVKELVRVESLEEIAALPFYTEAVFVTRPDDAKVEILAKLTNLRTLIQDGNSLVSDAGMKVLGQMYSLEELDLEWSENISDAGLAELKGLRRLRWLDVSFCRGITERGLKSLQANLPSCEIVA